MSDKLYTQKEVDELRLQLPSEWWEIFNKADQGGYVKVTYGTLQEFEASIQRLAQAVALKEAAEDIAPADLHQHPFEHQRRLCPQCCMAKRILALSDQPLLAQFETRLRAEAAAVMDAHAPKFNLDNCEPQGYWITCICGWNSDGTINGNEDHDWKKHVIPIPYADALAEELAKARLSEGLIWSEGFCDYAWAKLRLTELRSAIHRAAPAASGREEKR